MARATTTHAHVHRWSHWFPVAGGRYWYRQCLSGCDAMGRRT